MVLAAVESSSASIWAAIIAGVAAVAAITSAVIGWKTYRRARPAPAWRLDPGSDKHVCQLVQTGDAPARNVQITARAEDLEGNPSDEGVVRVDGALTHTELATGARVTLYLAVGMGTPSVRVHVHWTDLNGSPDQWASAPPS